jgi:hypothetical protein
MTETKTARGTKALKVAPLTMALVLTIALAVAPRLGAQAAGRILGTVTAINGATITVKPAQGDAQQVAVPSSAAIKRIEPGQTNLSAAVDMQFSELTVGDHVLVNLDPNSTTTPPQALRVVAIKGADVAKRQQQESEAWARGVGGLVKSIDTSNGTIVLATGAGPTAKNITVHVTAATQLERYAPASVRFDDATSAPISAIQPGDQLRARGAKNEDGTEITADAIVSGGFRNISGTIESIDPASSTLVVKDLATKKPVTVHITASAQMKQLPDRMAQMIAARLKGSGAAAAGGAPAAGGGAGNGGGARAGGAGGMDPQQILSRAPTIQLTDLQKNEAVMLVSTQGTSDVTAITLLAGVEPLLEAPASQDLLSNWSMGTGEAEAGAQ